MYDKNAIVNIIYWTKFTKIIKWMRGNTFSGVANSIIGERSTYSDIHILYDQFLLKSIVLMVCQHEHMNMCPPLIIEFSDVTEY